MGLSPNVFLVLSYKTRKHCANAFEPPEVPNALQMAAISGPIAAFALSRCETGVRHT